MGNIHPVIGDLSLEQVKAIKKLAERILCFFSDKEEIERSAKEILKYLSDQPPKE